MTGPRDPQSVEARKARYSRELAAYTLRQWDLVRRSMEDGNNREKSASPPGLPSRQGSSDVNGDLRSTPGIQAHDYAQSPHRQTNGRVVAGNA
ncbi:hypothetical protein FKP32DRAFT_1673671 [Trametes sanguinea]|nr:hypothetical protein FKP32DRAFT_1673671 [Trametes sanguinea]